MRFVKAHGAGNDFVLLPDLDDQLDLTPALTAALCRPHLGLGADGVIRVAPPGRGDADVFMDYRNADGSLAEMCGNGVRCVAKYVVDRGIVRGDVVRVETRGGLKRVEIAGRDERGCVASVRVDMGAPSVGPFASIEVPLTRLGPEQDADVGTAVVRRDTARLLTLSMGNPHAVLVVDDVAAAPVPSWGPVIERDPQFPAGTNVEFISVPSRERVRGRIWERGVGETMASGTGASAMAVAAAALGLAERSVVVELPGGELHVDWTDETLFVTGPAVEVASGEVDDAWLTNAS